MHVFPCGISVGFKDVAIVKFVAIVEGYGGGERDLFYTSVPLHHTVQRFMFLFDLTLELALWTHMYCSRGHFRRIDDKPMGVTFLCEVDERDGPM